MEGTCTLWDGRRYECAIRASSKVITNVVIYLRFNHGLIEVSAIAYDIN